MRTFKVTACLFILALMVISGCNKDEDPVPLQISFKVQNLTNPLDPDGSIDLQIIGGEKPYTIIWSGIDDAKPHGISCSNKGITEDLRNLSAGTYKVSVTDAAGDSICDSTVVEGPVTLVYFGQSYFEIISCKGIKIITDPSTVHMQGRRITGEADIVIASHNHEDHTNYSLISNYSLKVPPGTTDEIIFGDVKIEGYNSEHGYMNNVPMGPNTIYIFTIGDIRIAHLGENRAVTEEEILAALQDVDVLLAPVGEIASMSIPEVFELADRVDAAVVIPHHYRYSSTDKFYGSTTIDAFMSQVPENYTKEESEIYLINGKPEGKKVIKLITALEVL